MKNIFPPRLYKTGVKAIPESFDLQGPLLKSDNAHLKFRNSKSTSIDRIDGMAEAIQESIEAALGKTDREVPEGYWDLQASPYPPWLL